MRRVKYILLFIIFILILLVGFIKINIECSKSNYAIAGSKWQRDNEDIQKDEGYYKVLRELRDEAPIKILLNKDGNKVSINLKNYEINFKKDSFTNFKNNVLNLLDYSYHSLKEFLNKLSLKK